jgi:hypothetical protein
MSESYGRIGRINVTRFLLIAGAIITLYVLVGALGSWQGWGVQADESSSLQQQLSSTPLFVAPDGNCGIGVQPCYATIQAAVDAASDGDVIRIAAGVYTDVHRLPAPEGYCAPPEDGHITQTVLITKHLTIEGGYTTTNWIEPSAANPVIIDPQEEGRGVAVVDAAATISFITVTNGSAHGLAGILLETILPGATEVVSQTVGGGILGLNAALTLNDVDIITSRADIGGGVAVVPCSVTLDLAQYWPEDMLPPEQGLLETILSGNSATLSGALRGNGPSLTGIAGHSVRLGDNQADMGGGLAVIAAGATMTGTVLQSNAADMGGGAFGLGSLMALEEATFYGNEAWMAGGGLGSIFGTHRIESSTFISNTGTVGGALMAAASLVEVQECDFVENRAEMAGGALATILSAASLDDSVFEDNSGMIGGGLAHIMGRFALTDTYVLSNTAMVGGGAFVAGALPLGDMPLDALAPLLDTVGSHLPFGDQVSLSATALGQAALSGTPGSVSLTVDQPEWEEILALFGSAQFHGNEFAHNTAAAMGGLGMLLNMAELYDNEIIHNAAGFGGGVGSLLNHLGVWDSRIAENEGQIGGGLVHLLGGIELMRTDVLTNSGELAVGGGLIIGGNLEEMLLDDEMLSLTAPLIDPVGSGLGVTLLPPVESIAALRPASSPAGGPVLSGEMDILAFFEPVVISGCQIADNEAGLGLAGLAMALSDAQLVDNTIQCNLAPDGFVGGLGLALGLYDLEQNDIRSNQALGAGGASGAVAAVRMTGNDIVGNVSMGLGSGWTSLVTLGEYVNNVFADNTINLFTDDVRPLSTEDAITNSGAGLYLHGSQADMRHNTFARNLGVAAPVLQTTPLSNLFATPPGLYVEGLDIWALTELLDELLLDQDQSVGTGGGPNADINPWDILHLFDGSAYLARPQLQASLRNGPDPLPFDIPTVITGEVSLINSIMATHTLGISTGLDSAVSVQGMLWFENPTNYLGNVVATQVYTGNPDFVDPGCANSGVLRKLLPTCPLCVGGDYHIGDESDALNRGLLASLTGVYDDKDGVDRGPLPDLGAYELVDWPDVLYVNASTGTDAEGKGLTPDDPMATIQYAVDRVGRHGWVIVASGRYPERVVIDRPMTVRGRCVPTIEGVDSAALASEGTSQAVVIIAADDVRLVGFDLAKPQQHLTVDNGDDWTGVQVSYGSRVVIEFNNIANVDLGLKNKGVSLVKATHNWWGDADGPNGANGSRYQGVALVDPWLGSSLFCGDSKPLEPGEDTFEGKHDMGLDMTKVGGECPSWVSIARYEFNPQEGFLGALGAYYDAKIESPECIDELVIKFYVTAAELGEASMDEISVKFWDPVLGEWRDCSDQRTVIEASNGHVGFVEVTITDDTYPALSDLLGSEFALGGPIQVQRHIVAAPDPFCPGWRLHYRLELTNTTGTTLPDFTVEAALPEGIWAATDAGSTAVGVYDAQAETMSWSVGDLPVDGRVTAYVIANSYSSVASGKTLTTTFTFSSTILPEPGSEAIGLTADASICDPGPGPGPGATATPTPTPTATPTTTPSPTPTVTPTPTSACYLPLVTWDWEPTFGRP